MKTLSIPTLIGTLILFVSPLRADPVEADGSQHHHHHAGAPGAHDELGRVSFPTSCAAGVQLQIERGIALLHSFGYTEAGAQFETVARDDPQCAMAHWGVAMAQFTQIWGPPERKALALGAAEMAKARALSEPSAKSSARERAYIDALSAFFDGTDEPHQQRVDAYDAKMTALHNNFPDDVEGAAFAALAMLASEQPDDRSLSHEHRALAILQPLFLQHPEHPGLAHYIIHTCDTPALAQEGLRAARLYAKIAPSSAHALHMPAHIFSRLGMWQESIQSNLASVAASKSAEAAGHPGAAHQMHADEFLIYAYLQVAEDEKARQLTYGMQAVGDRMMSMPGMDDMKQAGHIFDNELRAVYAIEMHQWDILARLQPAAGSKPYEESSAIYWGQAIAAGHTSDAKVAAAALEGFEDSYQAMKKQYGDSAGTGSIRRNEILAWKSLAEGHADDAINSMRKAADEQDKVGQQEVDIPAREMLGDVLLLEHRPQEALAQYRVALQLSPNRLNALLGAAAAAGQAGLSADAHTYYRLIAKQTGNGASNRRPEVAHAVEAAAATTVQN